MDTIFALSSGALPAAIAVVRVSGPGAFAAGTALAGALPPARTAGLRTLRDSAGAPLDRGLVVVFPGPASATGEDLLELQLHGSRAVVAAVEAALAAHPGLRRAEPGEFTRRALLNGRLDLSQAEGLADLLAAETERARHSALASANGAITRFIQEWQARLTDLAAQVEALIDHAEEDDVVAQAGSIDALRKQVNAAADALAQVAARPPAERLRDGVRVVFAGPPNSGKSSLVNALAGREVAIATAIPGTTRDLIEAPVAQGGVAYVLTDTAGLRPDAADPVEAIGIDRARRAMASADLTVWLGDDDPPPEATLAVHARCDAPGRARPPTGRLAVSIHDPDSLAALWGSLGRHAAALLPREDEPALNRRQLSGVAAAAGSLRTPPTDPVLLAEQLRAARHALVRIVGADAVEGLLDQLFMRFCIGK